VAGADDGETKSMVLPRFCIRAALAGSGGIVSVTPYSQHIYPGCNKLQKLR